METNEALSYLRLILDAQTNDGYLYPTKTKAEPGAGLPTHIAEIPAYKKREAIEFAINKLKTLKGESV